MIEYSKVNVKLSDTQLKKLETAVKDETRTTIRITLKLIMEMICHINYCWQQDKKQN